MTNQEFSNEFDILYNNISSNQAPGLDEYEKSVFLTKAQDEIVKNYFNPKGNKYQEGFDGNEKRQIDFSMITKTKSYTTFSASTFDGRINNKSVKADIVMFDPPRKGLDKTSINNILKIKPKKIVYISCNPATLVRDLADFEDEYDIKTVIPVDMFPWTSHVECCSVLEIKQSA